MKQITIILLTFIYSTTYSQGKLKYAEFNKLVEVERTEYVIASVEHIGKLPKSNNQYLLFINTATGESNQIDFPKGSFIEKIEQVRIDSLGINRIVVEAKTVDLDGKKGIGWNDPKQVIVISTDGKEEKMLTDREYFVRNWIVNKRTGTITVVGHYDTNNNNKYDKSDENEIAIYSLDSLALLYRI